MTSKVENGRLSFIEFQSPTLAENAPHRYSRPWNLTISPISGWAIIPEK